MVVDVADGCLLVACFCLCLLGAVERRGGWNHHAIDADCRAQGVVIGIRRFGITDAAVRSAAIRHECSHFVAAADDDDAVVCNLRLVVGSEFAEVGRGVGSLCCGSAVVRGVKHHLLFVAAGKVPCHQFLLLKIGLHEEVAEWFCVAEPVVHTRCETSVRQTLCGERRKGRQFALFQLRERASWKEAEDDDEADIDEAEEEEICLVFFHELSFGINRRRI